MTDFYISTRKRLSVRGAASSDNVMREACKLSGLAEDETMHSLAKYYRSAIEDRAKSEKSICELAAYICTLSACVAKKTPILRWETQAMNYHEIILNSCLKRIGDRWDEVKKGGIPVEEFTIPKRSLEHFLPNETNIPEFREPVVEITLYSRIAIIAFFVLLHAGLCLIPNPAQEGVELMGYALFASGFSFVLGFVPYWLFVGRKRRSDMRLCLFLILGVSAVTGAILRSAGIL